MSKYDDVMTTVGVIDGLRKKLEQAERQRDRAEQKADGYAAMMAAAPGPEGWEVTEVDGERGIVPVDWRGRALAAEFELKAMLQLSAGEAYEQLESQLEQRTEGARPRRRSPRYHWHQVGRIDASQDHAPHGRVLQIRTRQDVPESHHRLER